MMLRLWFPLSLGLSLSPLHAQVGWAVGGNGGIYRSSDGGSTWTGRFPVSVLLNDVFTFDGFTGWIAGGQMLLKTTDGGATWRDTYRGGAILNSVDFVTPSLGWAVGNTGAILKSTDGGESWSGSYPVSSILNCVRFVSATTGFIGGGQVILKTSNGGSSWTNKYRGGGVINGIYFVSSSTGWAVGNTGEIAKTTNGGETWTSQYPSSKTLTDVWFTSSTTGFVVGGSVILKTTNGGKSWTSVYSGGAFLDSVFFLSSSTGWASGSSGTILKTTDGGNKWVTQGNLTSASLRSIVFVPARPATVARYGQGCRGGAGTPVLDAAPGSLPWLGDRYTSRASSLSSRSTGAIFVTGVSQTPAVSLRSLGLPTCSSFVTYDLLSFVPASRGSAEWSATIPRLGSLAGAKVYQQVLVLDPSASGGAAMTNAIQLVFGMR